VTAIGFDQAQSFTVTQAMLVWFSRTVDLYAMLDEWRGESSNYDHDDSIDGRWYSDNHETELSRSTDRVLYEKAARRLLGYRYYPDSVLTFVADFTRYDRLPLPGDRIVQRIRVIPFLLDAITMNIVKSVWHDADSSGFTIVTSEHHYEMGDWTAVISNTATGQITLGVRVTSRPSDRLPFFARGFARNLQMRAHEQARKTFVEGLREYHPMESGQASPIYERSGAP